MDVVEWLESVETVEADDATEVGSGRADFLAGAALAGVNLFVSAAVILAWLLQSAGTLLAGVVDLTRYGIPSSLPTQSAAAFAVVVGGSLLGLAIGVGGFAASARKRWVSYYWPVFGIAIALASPLVASRV
jgi:hypothetical protein